MANAFDRAGAWGTMGNNPQSTGGPNDFGIQKNYLGSSYTQPEMYTGDPMGKGLGWNGEITPGYTTNTFNGPGGQFSSQGGKAWTDSFGNQIQDLGQYTQSKDRQSQGSDFTGYKNQLDSALGTWKAGNDNATSSLARQQGINADYQALLKDPSKVQQTAGYQFATDQGNQAINRSAAAKGMLNSGNVLAELSKYGQGMASQQYDQQLKNILSGGQAESQLGQNVNQNLAGQGAQVNALSGLMSGAQKFGVDSGYYNPQQYLNPLDVKRSESKSWSWSGKAT